MRHHDSPALAERRSRTGRLRTFLAQTAIVLGVLAATAFPPTASAAQNHERGPDPTPAGIAAPMGPFAIESVQVPRGNGFGGGVIYYPTDTSQGTFGGLAISPGWNGTWPGIAWLGPRLASQGFVVFGIDTNTLNDDQASRGTQLLAALDYLTQRSPVRDRVDADRLAVAGHSMGGGGAFHASLQRPSLRTAIGNAPFWPGSLSGQGVPTLVSAMQNDGLVGQNRNAYNSIPAGTEKAYIEIAGADHNYIGQPSTHLARTWIPWLKIFLDEDTRYHEFLCPALYDSTGISQYLDTCSFLPTATQTPEVSVSGP
ncbi:dienelactone hydrolase family protein [Streptomyces sp. SBT349]|uniref:dienelactone hydrolase family protein n=1 Tax=Streptomyces sp. SBT349 TaxID=1580539 RepID=UPI000A4FA727|nr:alpha/beta hydrolase [Streptomyces sp. SBT349]